MTTDQVEYTADELLADHQMAEPLVVDGLRCHGGFDEAGTYVSPRTANRGPAIEAWEAQRAADFGSPVLDIGLETWPEHFPNVEQTKLLLRSGVREPAISALTRIGTVEAFGSMLRLLPPIDWQASFDESVQGTAIDHIHRGLFEAHARDEAGFDDVAGHDQMWFAARDIAFEHPVTEDQSELMLERMGIVGTGGKPKGMPPRVLPEAIDPMVEMTVGRMINLLFIEISAFHGFAWAEAVLADEQLTAGEGEGSRIVSYIRSDETPHVAYLRTALSEMRDRTWVGSDGSRHDGADMIGTMWDSALEASTGPRRDEFLAVMLGELRHAVADRADGDDLLDEVLALGNVRRLDDGRLVDDSDRRLAGGDAA